jgi:hypothetical protein
MAVGSPPMREYADYQPVLLDRLKRIRDGYISIIKQDSRIIQINICDRINIDVIKIGKGAVQKVMVQPPSSRGIDKHLKT